MDGPDEFLPVKCAVLIRARIAPDGTLSNWAVQEENMGLGEEVVITLTRNWLQAAEERYHARFLGRLK